MTTYILTVKDKNGNTALAWELDSYEKAVEMANEKRSNKVYVGFTFVLTKQVVTCEDINIWEGGN